VNLPPKGKLGRRPGRHSFRATVKAAGSARQMARTKTGGNRKEKR